MGECRFSRLAPAWGELYGVSGDSKLLLAPDDWIVLAQSSKDEPAQHYLFYFKDETFECVARSLSVQLPDKHSLIQARNGRPASGLISSRAFRHQPLLADQLLR